MRKIVTEFVHPPIPWRHMDWAAYYDGDEPDDEGAMPHGTGETQQAAIDDLVEAFPLPGEGECPDCFFCTPVGVTRCASCEGTGVQLSTEPVIA